MLHDVEDVRRRTHEYVKERMMKSQETSQETSQERPRVSVSDPSPSIEEQTFGELRVNPPAGAPVEGYDVVRPTEESILMCARVIHVTVEAMNRAHNELTLEWEQSRDSLLAGVRRVLENPGESPEENHNAWIEQRAREGWVYGPTKDLQRKTHPCMVPYAALGPFQQSKDQVFLAIVREFFGAKPL